MSVAAAAALVTLHRLTSRFTTAGGSGLRPRSEVSGPGLGERGEAASRNRIPNAIAHTSAAPFGRDESSATAAA